MQASSNWDNSDLGNEMVSDKRRVVVALDSVLDVAEVVGRRESND